VIIAVTVKNTGKEGIQPVELYINDVLEEEKQIDLNFSEIKDILFNVTKRDLGAYRVTVDKSTLSKVFFVESSTPVPVVTGGPTIEEKPQLKVVIGLSVIVILIYLLRIYLKINGSDKMVARIIAIASGKGGVGKTTIALNLGFAMASLKKNVLVIDTDVSLPNLDLYTGLEKPLITLLEVLNGSANIQSAIYSIRWG